MYNGNCQQKLSTACTRDRYRQAKEKTKHSRKIEKSVLKEFQIYFISTDTFWLLKIEFVKKKKSGNKLERNNT